jgi:hypothetical protein
MTVEVIEDVVDYLDPWTREVQPLAVRFTMRCSDGTSSMGHTLSLPTFLRIWVDSDDTAEVTQVVDETSSQMTREERVAAVAKRFGRGTRVKGWDGSTYRTGTVNGRDYGALNNPTHVNHGRVYLGVTWDEGHRSNAFADELTSEI